VSPEGISTVARQEFTIRIRAGRWRWLLAIWFVLLSLFTLLMRTSISRVGQDDATDKGVVVYGGLALLVLALALLVSPALSAQSVNGDRERGTLATLQVTRLTAGDIAFGKLAAAWGTSLVFVALSLPLIGYAMTLGGVPLVRVLVSTLVLVLLLGSVIAMALCLSTLLSRTTTSGLLAYLVVFVLCVGTLMAFGLGTALTTEKTTITTEEFCPSDPRPGVPQPDGTFSPVQPPEGCQPAQTFDTTRSRTDKVWWLLAPNPFVVLADAAPRLPDETEQERLRREQLQRQGIATSSLRDSDPLGAIGNQVRGLRLKPGETTEVGQASTSETPRLVERRAVWPYGLAFDVLLGIGAMWLTTQRLRTPTRTLPKGQRVA